MSKQENDQKWYDYYNDLIRKKGNVDAFKKKYSVFFDLAAQYFKTTDIIKEEGCGTGFASACISDRVRPVSTIFSDINPLMILLAQRSRRWVYSSLNDPLYAIEDMTKSNLDIKNIFKLDNDVNIVTHGVLEHFSDEQLAAVLDRYRNDKKIIYSAHYVPLDGYTEKSFGDERLLPAKFWVDKFKPIHWIVQNDQDLFFICKHH